MASIQIGGNDKLQVLADLIYLARHSPAGSEMQLRSLDLAAEVILQAEVRCGCSTRGKWRTWLQRGGQKDPLRRAYNLPEQRRMRRGWQEYLERLKAAED